MYPQITRLLLAAVLTTTGLLSPTFTALALSDAGHPGSHALLIGITAYQTFAPLKGAVNDVDTMQQVLLTRYGFAPDHIRTLTNEQASRRNILSAIEQLQKTTEANDTIYIHSSSFVP